MLDICVIIGLAAHLACSTTAQLGSNKFLSSTQINLSFSAVYCSIVAAQLTILKSLPYGLERILKTKIYITIIAIIEFNCYIVTITTTTNNNYYIKLIDLFNSVVIIIIRQY